MHDFIKHTILNNTFLLSGSRCIFWEEEKALIISDCHFGKTGHFRKNGIAVPQTVFKEDMQRLTAQIQFFNPSSLIIVGDLFHSHANKEMNLFIKWRQDFSELRINLIIGNHDILEEDWYKKTNIVCYKEQLKLGNFIFTHDEFKAAPEDGFYTFSGHIHPAVSLHGTAKQSLKFPCFYFGKSSAVIPAFGRFTGLHTINPQKKDSVFAIVENKVMRLS